MEDVKEATDSEIANYRIGYMNGKIDGVTLFAWWKDGVQYVGTCGTTLAEAIESIKKGDK